MTLECQKVFETLSEWPCRGTGTENEMMARESLITLLEGEADIDIVEEAFYVPPNYTPFLATIMVGQILSIWLSDAMPAIAALSGIILFVSFFLFYDGRYSPLVWLMPKRLTANLAASKGSGQNVFILVAHLDSAPSSLLHRRGWQEYRELILYLATLIVFMGALLPIVEGYGFIIPDWFRLLLTLVLIGLFGLFSWDYWLNGFSSGANKNLSGVSAAVSAVTRLWQEMPANTEVRLLLTSASEGGQLGVQHYLRQHEDALKYQNVYVVNFDTVGNECLGYVLKSNNFLPVNYDNELTKLAKQFTEKKGIFSDVQPSKTIFDGSDAVCFKRYNIPTISLISYDENGMSPYSRTQYDLPRYVNMKTIALASDFCEALIKQQWRVLRES